MSFIFRAVYSDILIIRSKRVGHFLFFIFGFQRLKSNT